MTPHKKCLAQQVLYCRMNRAIVIAAATPTHGKCQTLKIHDGHHTFPLEKATARQKNNLCAGAMKDHKRGHFRGVTTVIFVGAVSARITPLLTNPTNASAWAEIHDSEVSGSGICSTSVVFSIHSWTPRRQRLDFQRICPDLL